MNDLRSTTLHLDEDMRKCPTCHNRNTCKVSRLSDYILENDVKTFLEQLNSNTLPPEILSSYREYQALIDFLFEYL